MIQVSVSPQASAFLLTLSSTRQVPAQAPVAAPLEQTAASRETTWRVPYWVVLVALWALFVVPGISLRGVIYEEQTVIGLARGAVEDGHWVSPHLYGIRFVERPVLMSWMIALLSWPFGMVPVALARLPAVLSALGGAMLVFRLVGRTETALAGFYAGLCFLTAPMITEKFIVAEPDVMLSVLLFGAFVLWWEGHAAGKVSIARWLMVGVIIGLAGLVKGPQPLAYFFIGVFAWLALLRRWNEVAGLVLAGLIASLLIGLWYLAVYQTGDLAHWIAHSRIGSDRTLGQRAWNSADFAVRGALALLPGMALLPLLLRQEKEAGSSGLWLALLLYAAGCTVVLLVWPSARARYAMPATPAVAALAGILFARMRLQHPWPFRISNTLIAVLVGYQLVLGWLVVPSFPGLFTQPKRVGDRMAAVIRSDPAPLYAINDAIDLAPLVYVPGPIRDIPPDKLIEVDLPAWAIVSQRDIAELQARWPDLDLDVRLLIPEYQNTRLVHIRMRQK